MHPTFVKKIGLIVQNTNVSTQKIDSNTFETDKIVVAVFLVTDQADKIRFFEEIFLVANNSPDVVLGILFFTTSGAKVDFVKKKL